nr:hypothetical protein CFP56_34942 [Quercus suber]
MSEARGAIPVSAIKLVIVDSLCCRSTMEFSACRFFSNPDVTKTYVHRASGLRRARNTTLWRRPMSKAWRNGTNIMSQVTWLIRVGAMKTAARRLSLQAYSARSRNLSLYMRRFYGYHGGQNTGTRSKSLHGGA